MCSNSILRLTMWRQSPDPDRLGSAAFVADALARRGVGGSPTRQPARCRRYVSAMLVPVNQREIIGQILGPVAQMDRAAVS